jgi:hypothetical protein
VQHVHEIRRIINGEEEALRVRRSSDPQYPSATNLQPHPIAAAQAAGHPGEPARACVLSERAPSIQAKATEIAGRA